MALVQEVGQHRRCGSLAVRASHAEALHAAREQAQHIGALLNLEALAAKPRHFLVVGGDSRGINHEGVGGIAECRGNACGVVGIVYLCAFFGKTAGEFGFGAVVAANGNALGQIVAHERAHSDAAGTYEIDGF